MTGIALLTIIVALAVIVLLFTRDARRLETHRRDRLPATPPREPARPEPLRSEVAQALAGHVRELRRAVDQGLIERDEAIASIVRQSDGGVGEGAAERLLDSAESE